MTRDDIIRMAREAGFRAGCIELYNGDPLPFIAPCSATDCMPEIERFAAIVAGSGAAEIEALRARIAEMERQEPIGWFTEDHLTDRSATTYDAATASRWAEKGWPVGCLYAGPGAQQRPADPAAAEEDDDLYWRLHAMSKSLEGAGRLDEHDNPDVYGTVLDAMNFVKQHRGQRGEE